jgi:hypothetical protein
MQQVQNNQDDHDNEQHVNPASGANAGDEPWANEAEQPQDEQNYDDSPQHDVPPLALIAWCGAARYRSP